MNAQQYAVLYVFDVKSGSEAVFEAAWKSVTEAIQSESGSGGSRLHKSQNGTYWAHALWPSRAALEGAELSESVAESRQQMVEACDRIEVLGEGDVVVDCWQVERP
ncbi:MAG TPA: hypothetical protein DDZ19_05865 [Flavobacteriales bacterium]|jgi:heme-degrading monooxygenase HmoA|nr:hypothetical protein [Flavobacteriales bacterium]